MEDALVKREFTLENEHTYDRSSPVRWVLSHLARYPLLPLAVVATMVATHLLWGSIRVRTGEAFDLITSEGWAPRALLSIAMAVVGAAVGHAVLNMISSIANEFIAQRIERDARDELYASLLGKSQTFHGRQRIGDIMARATNDVRMLNAIFSPGIYLIIDSTMSLIIPSILIARLSPRLLLVPAIFIVLLAITLVDYNRRLHPVSTARREQFGAMNSDLAEAIAGIEVVKGNAQGRNEWLKFAKNAARFKDLFVQQGEIEAKYLPGLAFVLCRALAFFQSLWLWTSGNISLGDVIAFTGLFYMFEFPTFISMFTFNLVQLGIASAERILELINTETELDQNERGIAQPIRGRVEFQDVGFAYDGQPILSGISFVAEPGETIAIVGQTGSGKTTLTRLINRIFDADEGTVLVDGVDVREWSMESLRSQISTIEQDVFLYSRSLAENIAFGAADATQEAIEHAAREAQAHEFITGFAEAYETEVGERGVTLSGGQRQRIAIARAFLINPRILVLDDSTSAIDSATEDEIQRAMRRISEERTTFIITHRLSQIRWADRILVLRGGDLVDQGTHDELLERSDAYRRIFARYD